MRTRQRFLTPSAVLLLALALVASLLYGIVAPTAANAAGLTGLTFTNTDIPVVETGTNQLKMTVPSGATQTHMTAAFSTGSASYTVNGGSSTSLTAGTASGSIPINDGLTTILVTHVDGSSTTVITVYLLKVRPLTAIEVNGRTLSPAFDPAVFTYTVTVPYSATTAEIRANWNTTTDGNATGFTFCIDTGVTGVSQTPNTYATLTDLAVGSNYRNLILLTDTPQGQVGGCTSGIPRRYTVIVERESAFTAGTLSALTLTNSDISLSGLSTPYSFSGMAQSGSTSTKVTATFSTGTATYSVDGGSSVSLTSAAASSAIPLNDGLTTITVTHVGTSTTTYTMYVTKVRPLTGIEVEDGTLSPAFDPAVFTYTVTVPYNQTRTRIKANWDSTTTTNATGFSYCIDTGFPGPMPASGVFSEYGDLSVGSNYRNLLLQTNTPQGWVGGCTSGFPKRYEVNIVRENAFSATTLSALTLTNSDISLSPSATPYFFTGTAQTGSTSTKVTATFATGTATYAVTGGGSGTLTSGSASPALALNDGLTTITVTHVGATTTTYTMYITKVRSITGFQVEGGTITPAFDPAVFSYTVTLPNSTERTRIKATWNTTTTANATDFSYCIDTGFPGPMPASGAWSEYGDLSVGGNYRNLLLQTNTPQGWVGGCTSGFPQRYGLNIIRASAFSGIGGVTTNAPAIETPVPAGTTITAAPVDVTGVPTPTVTYEWEAAPAPTDTFTVVAVTSTPSWAPDNSVAGQYVRVSALARNGVSIDAEATSATFGPIAGVNEAPGISSVSISGTARVGDTLTASVAATGFPRPTLAYSWESAATVGGTYTSISGATGSSYTPPAAMVGQFVRVVVTASNTSGADATGTSAATGAVVEASSESVGGSASGSGSNGSATGSPGRPGVQPITDTRPVGGFLPGTTVVTVGGTPASTSTSEDPTSGRMTVQGADFIVTITPQSTSSSMGPVSPVGFASPQGGSFNVTGTGYLPGTTVSAFLIPDDARNPAAGSSTPAPAISVGSSDVLSDGTIQMRADIPQQTDVGAYVLQINGYTPALQIRTLNVGLDVTVSTAVTRTTTVITSAFFTVRSAEFSSAGVKKLRQALALIPAGSKDIRLDVMAVSVGQKTVKADRRLATKRARALVTFLAERGVSGATTITLLTSANIDKVKRTEYQQSAKGHPLSTVKVTFEPSSTGG